MKIEDELESFFLVHDYQWKIDGIRRYPTADEIRQTIDKAMSDMYSESEGTQIEVGRLIIKKHDSGYAVYVLTGEIND